MNKVNYKNRLETGTVFCIVPVFDGIFIGNVKLKYKYENGGYKYEKIIRNSTVGTDEIDVFYTNDNLVIADFDQQKQNKKINFNSIESINMLYEQIGYKLIKKDYTRTRYGFAINDGWENLERVTIITKTGFRHILSGWYLDDESRKIINDVLRDVRAISNEKDTMVTLDDCIMAGCCSSGISNFIKENNLEGLDSINSRELLLLQDNAEIRNAILLAKKRDYDENSRKQDRVETVVKQQINSDEFWLKELPCEYRGDIIEQVNCELCGSNQVSVPVFSCEIHGKCSLSKRSAGLKACSGCTDRK